jgi:hypothetical protein
VVLATLAGSDEVQTVVPIGWGGDRFRLYQAGASEALIWYLVWDDARSAERFERSAAGLKRTARPGYKAMLESVRIGDRSATRFVLAPEGWGRWGKLPEVTVEGALQVSP